jgi:hypothetical protein
LAIAMAARAVGGFVLEASIRGPTRRITRDKKPSRVLFFP